MIALTGATGLVGRWLLPHCDLTLGRRASATLPNRKWELSGPAPDLTGVTTLIHAAFSHVPGRYRGGEGSDPQSFLSANLHGTIRLFNAAHRAGVQRIIFLSSRAVFDGLPAGTDLTEDRTPKPKSLYGQVKTSAEAHLAGLPLTGISLRATGVYGPAAKVGAPHKWQGLFQAYRSGTPVEPRRGTEVHGLDLANAVQLLLHQTDGGPVHLSDILLDRHDLLAEVQRLTDCPHPPPQRSNAPVSPLICSRLNQMGWHPGGLERLYADLPQML